MSMNGLAMLMAKEQLRLEAYDDKTGHTLAVGQKCIGVPTIGYGHTGADVVAGLTWTEEKAREVFHADVVRLVQPALAFVKVPLNQNQVDALGMFIFNVGAGAFEHSTMLKMLNLNCLVAASCQFAVWCHDAGGVNPGLVNRRKFEYDLFVKPTY